MNRLDGLNRYLGINGILLTQIRAKTGDPQYLLGPGIALLVGSFCYFNDFT